MQSKKFSKGTHLHLIARSSIKNSFNRKIQPSNSIEKAATARNQAARKDTVSAMPWEWSVLICADAKAVKIVNRKMTPKNYKRLQTCRLRSQGQ